jgi:RNA polymerase-binding transcription factor DksA
VEQEGESVMANRQLNEEELEKARALLDRIRTDLAKVSEGNPELLFAYRRKIYKELTYDERGKPMTRRKLKEQKWKEQRGLCATCGKELPEKYTVLDRLNAIDGYTEENTRLIHQECDVAQQHSKRYA